MKIRQLVLGAIAGAAFLTLVLGLAGVFAPPARPPVIPDDQSDTSPGTLQFTDFIVRRGNLVLRAADASVTLEGTTKLHQPRLEMVVTEERRDGAEGKAAVETKIRAKADEGVQGGGSEPIVTLSGNVVIEAEGGRQGVIKADTLVWNNGTRKGTLEGAVEFWFRTPGGEQRGSCRGAEWDVATRSGAMLSDVELILSGWSLNPSDGEPETEKSEPVVARCDGRASFDELAGLAELRRNVRVEQAKAGLECDRLALDVNMETRQVREATAVGNVRFASEADGLAGEGDRLVRLVGDDSIELTGDPLAELTYKGATLRAPRLTMRGQSVQTWGAGDMAATIADGEEEGETRDVSIAWEGRMAFSLADRFAEFRRGVVFQDGETRLTCQDLTLRFDEEGRRAERVEAVGNVRFQAPQGTGSGDRLIVDAASGAFQIFGRPAELAQEDRSFVGSELTIEEGGDVIRTSKAGVLSGALAGVGEEGEGDGLGVGGGVARAEWSRSMRYAAADKTLVLEGDVVVEGEEGTLSGDVVAVNQAQRTMTVEGEGELDVAVPPKDEPAEEDPASLLALSRTGKPTRLKIAWREGMAYSDAERTATFSEGVRLTHENYALDAESLTVRFDENRDLASGLAEGDVRMADKERGYQGKGRKLEWEVESGVAKLWGAEGDPAELTQDGGTGVLSRLITFSDNFRTVTMEAPESRPRERR